MGSAWVRSDEVRCVVRCVARSVCTWLPTPHLLAGTAPASEPAELSEAAAEQHAPHGDVARVGAMEAGYDESVPGKQINRFCASGLEAVNSAVSQMFAEGRRAPGPL